ncbi:MAG: nucleoside deaminase [Candidatus Omnitrophica bacterium]|nr:nucleoside deaminase [Candidatus Omnitrophota bacterium]
MREAIKEATRSFEKGEIPVGAVIVHDKKIIARAHNQMETLHDPTAHAEMIAITQAAETLAEGKRDHRGSLEGATLYVTMEPCPMCAGALVLSKAKGLVYAAEDSKAGACGSLYNIVSDDRLNHRLSVRKGILADESKQLLQEFFKTLRKDRR